MAQFADYTTGRPLWLEYLIKDADTAEKIIRVAKVVYPNINVLHVPLDVHRRIIHEVIGKKYWDRSSMSFEGVQIWVDWSRS